VNQQKERRTVAPVTDECRPLVVRRRLEWREGTGVVQMLVACDGTWTVSCVVGWTEQEFHDLRASERYYGDVQCCRKGGNRILSVEDAAPVQLRPGRNVPLPVGWHIY